MDNRTIDSINSEVYRKFPELSGAHPKIQRQDPSDENSNYLLIYHGSGLTADGRRIDRTVRVVASEKGKIIKMTTSR